MSQPDSRAADPWVSPGGGSPPAWVDPSRRAHESAPARPGDLFAQLRIALGVAVPCVLLGAPLGLAWAALRPRLDPLVVSAAAESALQRQFTIDMILAALGALGGLGAAVVVWLFVRRHPVGSVVGLAVGGWGAMLVAERVGRAATHPDHLRADTQAALAAHGDRFAGSATEIKNFLDLLSFQLKSPGVLLTFSVVAVLGFALLTGIRSRSSGVPEPYRLSWDSAAVGSAPEPAPPSAS